MLVLVTGVCVMWRQAGPHCEHRQLGDIEYVRTEEPFRVSAQKAFLALATSLMEEKLFRWLIGVDFGVTGAVTGCCCCSVVLVVVVVEVFRVRAGRMLLCSEIHGWLSIWFIDGRFLKKYKRFLLDEIIWSSILLSYIYKQVQVHRPKLSIVHQTNFSDKSNWSNF